MYKNYRNLIDQYETGSTWNLRDELREKPIEHVLDFQPKFHYAVCVCNVLGSLNTGNIIRTSVCFGADKVFITGRKRVDARSTVGADNYIEMEYLPETYDETKSVEECINFPLLFQMIRYAGYTPVLIEQGGLPMEHESFMEIYKPCFIFGNEGIGIPEKFVQLERSFEIPMYGVLRSLNVAVAAGIVIQNYVGRLDHV